ncbi:MAG: ABC transporter ATP-binding protein [Clostridiales bacterium]|nr:ABC transporter ATP-binding protein [Clostridiales bacterium]
MQDQNIVLKTEGLTKYFGKRRIINSISLEVRAGEIFGFLGPNGSGKTTTIKMILGLLDIDAGKVYIGGCDREKDFENALRQIGGIIENPDTYGYMSGYRNLEYYSRLRGKLDRARIDEVVKLVGLEKRINDKVKTYSLGMKQRLGLAQAIVHRPKVLVLDEPTNGLDPAGMRELRDTLKYLAESEGIAVFVSSHILSEMQLLCDRVCIISAGSVLRTCDVSELLDEQTHGYRFILRPADQAQAVVDARLPGRLLGREGEAFDLACDESEVPGLILELMQNGAAVYGVQPAVRTLEDSFMEITGGGNTIA